MKRWGEKAVSSDWIGSDDSKPSGSINITTPFNLGATVSFDRA
jgi:hypothetical protein